MSTRSSTTLTLLLAGLILLAGLDAARAAPFLVKDIDNGTGGAWPIDLMAVDDRVFFTVPGFEGNPYSSALWRSDGTAAGSLPLLVSPGGEIMPIGAAGGHLFALGNDRTLLATDGTPEGTTEVARLSEYAFRVSWVAARGLFFFLMPPGTAPGSLWVSDGTPEGTHHLLDTPVTSNRRTRV